MTAASASSWTATSASSRAGQGRNFTPASTASFGTQFSVTNLDNLMLVSGVEAPPTIRLFNLWIEQDLAKGASLRLGQFTAAQEFIVSRNADLFVNSTFGWPMLNTQNLPSGGPNYPEAALGARLQFKFGSRSFCGLRCSTAIRPDRAPTIR
jgi:porin